MRRFFAFALLAAVLAACDDDGGIELGAEFTVMTRNIYVGTDIDILMTATPEEIPALVAQLWAEIQATDSAWIGCSAKIRLPSIAIDFSLVRRRAIRATSNVLTT